MVKHLQDCAGDQSHKGMLRKHYRQLRRSLDANTQQKAAIALSRRLIRCKYFLRAKNIAVYWPDDGEISLLPFIEQAWRMRKNIYLPVVTQNNFMQFARLSPSSQLTSGKWGIALPVPTHAIKPLVLDTMLVPLVAFDKNGNRLGRGGGYYDLFINNLSRFKSAKPQQLGQTKKPVIIGVAHQLQLIDSISPEPWDMPVDSVLTDKSSYYFT